MAMLIVRDYSALDNSGCYRPVSRFNPNLAEFWRADFESGMAQVLYWTAMHSGVQFRKFVLRTGWPVEEGKADRIEYIAPVSAVSWLREHGYWDGLKDRADMQTATGVFQGPRVRRRAPAPGGEGYTAHVQITVRPTEKEVWSLAAEEAGMGMSEFISRVMNLHVFGRAEGFNG